MGIAELVAAAKEFGIFEFYLPFILMFAVIYGLLAKSRIFGEAKERPASTINLVVSLVAAAFIMVYTPAGITLAAFISNLFGGTLVVLLSILAFLIIAGLVIPSLTGRALGTEVIGTKWIPLLILGILALAVGVFISSGGTAVFPGVKIPWVQISIPSAENLAIIVVVVLTGLIIWWLARGGEERGVEVGRR